jgi:hypothetical protein
MQLYITGTVTVSDAPAAEAMTVNIVPAGVNTGASTPMQFAQ